MIRVADHIVDIGLGAGEQGGRVVYSGDLPGLLLETRSLTAKYLRHELAIPVPSPRRRGLTQKIKLKGATEHNLKDVDIAIPLNTLTCVTGVSGSGKSTLVHDVLYAAIKRAKGDWDRRVGTFRGLEGLEYISDVILVDQTPIGRTPRSNPVTYLKAFESDSRAVRADARRQVTRLCPRATSRSTCRADAARRARVRAKCASRCSSSPTCSCRATSATACASSRRCST
jgi:excinuclease ABC subunit A